MIEWRIYRFDIVLEGSLERWMAMGARNIFVSDKFVYFFKHSPMTASELHGEKSESLTPKMGVDE